ncbi:Aspartate/methionine/tyrosine aminotransferase [Cohaesibacter sp. ES.047]|uniref:aminotransferase class I/II-fold pyridoxal phosphate-dependent enzyme n=1 Tax=Cohaesibacter sp. ES.047 TaxID=1798205 RepID=UPI000BB6D9F1|nr:aminotransferase class I/II-fold pyridoxal phosphate-dependent enzyme [Cohaesibacter sp. ES.047]SNY90637.1 Aspartate/methionine/tyrosine aminotransferase [Cohaesibacter sp. ES.047]
MRFIRSERLIARMQDERSPFQKLADLLCDIVPANHDRTAPINMTIGEPGHAYPAFIPDVIIDNKADFGRYPPMRGTDDFRKAVEDWLNGRYDLGGLPLGEKNILPLNGTREGLFHAVIGARDWARFHFGKRLVNPAVLLPNPFYHTYIGAARAIEAEPVFLNGTPETGFLPDLDALAEDTKLLDRTVAFFYASPANPQGNAADIATWKKLIALARKHDFLILADECYSELYRETPPAGILEACEGDFSHVVTFHSLSKRSNLPGLRCGFAAGDPAFLTEWTKYRNLVAPQVSMPLQAAGAAAYRDEEHVIENRRLYNEKFDCVDRILGKDLPHDIPLAGFFLWLDVSAFGDDVSVTEKLWREVGVRVIPGSYLARPDISETNPGDGFLRIALVGTLEETKDAMTRLRACLIG